jgi:hypothetical protein
VGRRRLGHLRAGQRADLSGRLTPRSSPGLPPRAPT